MRIMKMTATLSTMVLLILTFLSACGQTKPLDNPQEKPQDVVFIEAANENSIILVQRFDGRLISYDTKTQQVNKWMNRYKAFFIHSNNPEYNYHTAGDSYDYGFSIISVGEKQITVELQMQSNEAIHTLAFSEEYLFFIKTLYQEPGVILDQYVVRYDPAAHNIIEYRNLRELRHDGQRGSISSGAIINDRLYYSIYNEDSDTYSIYEADCADKETMPQIWQDNLEWGDVYSQGQDLYLSDKTSIFCGDKRFPRQAENYFIGDKYLLQYVNTFDARLLGAIIDTETGKTVIQTTNNIMGVKVIDNEIIMYCEGAIERFQYR